jgi:hypothetical protein
MRSFYVKPIKNAKHTFEFYKMKQPMAELQISLLTFKFTYHEKFQNSTIHHHRTYVS